MIEAITKQLYEKDGIWMSENSEEVSYPPERHDILFELEENSFWFQHRNRCIETVVKRLPPSGVVIDVGGGNGYVTKMLSDLGYETILIEPNLKGCLNAKERGLKNIICASFDQISYKDAPVGGIGFFDVLEHLDREERVLRSAFEALRPDGKLYVTCPAHSWLWSCHDVLAGHYRRYTKESLSRLLNMNGFRVQFISYFFAHLFVPVFLFRRLPHLLGKKKATIKKSTDCRDHRPIGFVKNLADLLLNAEYNDLQKSDVKYGTSLIVVAEKKKNHFLI